MELLAVGYNDGALWAYADLAAWLPNHGVEFHRINPASDAEIIARGQTADIILAYKYRISRELMMALPQLTVLMSSGSGYDHIDVDAATDRGIVVTNAATHNVDDVAHQSCTGQNSWLDRLRRHCKGRGVARQWHRVVGRRPLAQRIAGGASSAQRYAVGSIRCIETIRLRIPPLDFKRSNPAHPSTRTIPANEVDCFRNQYQSRRLDS